MARLATGGVRAYVSKSYTADDGRRRESEPDARIVLNADEVAKMLAVTTTWVYARSRDGLIPTVKLVRYYRYRPEAIEHWIETQELG